MPQNSLHYRVSWHCSMPHILFILLWFTPLLLSPSAQHSLHRTGIRYSTESATPRLGGSSGRMADHAQLTPSVQERRAGNCVTILKVCSHIVLKCLCLARLGRLDILWFVSNVRGAQRNQSFVQRVIEESGRRKSVFPLHSDCSIALADSACC